MRKYRSSNDFIFIIALLILISTFLIKAQDNPLNDPSLNVEYKRYQKFDLGNLSIKGNILTPGDVSVRDRLPSSITNDIFNRKNFNDYMKKDINDIK